MSKTMFFKEYIVFQPDINKIEEEIIIYKVINCKDNCFQSFEFDCICDVKFRDFKNKKIIDIEIRDDGLIKNV